MLHGRQRGLAAVRVRAGAPRVRDVDITPWDELPLSSPPQFFPMFPVTLEPGERVSRPTCRVCGMGLAVCICPNHAIKVRTLENLRHRVDRLSDKLAARPTHGRAYDAAAHTSDHQWPCGCLNCVILALTAADLVWLESVGWRMPDRFGWPEPTMIDHEFR